MKEDTVIDILIKSVIESKMYRFAFLLYGNYDNPKWKGCGDFVYVTIPRRWRVTSVDTDHF